MGIFCGTHIHKVVIFSGQRLISVRPTLERFSHPLCLLFALFCIAFFHVFRKTVFSVTKHDYMYSFQLSTEQMREMLENLPSNKVNPNLIDNLCITYDGVREHLLETVSAMQSIMAPQYAGLKWRLSFQVICGNFICPIVLSPKETYPLPAL